MMLLFLLKLTAFLSAGFLALALAHRTTAAARHTLCAGVLAVSLLLPLSAFVPVKPLVLYTAAFTQSVAPSTAARAGVGNTSLTTVLALIWMLGCAVIIARLITGYHRLAQLRRSAQDTGAGVWFADVNVPVAVGLWKPVALVPRDFSEWPAFQQQAALHHELAHIQRRDLWANLGGNIACAVYWFHPLIWLLYSRTRAEQETACDDAVIANGFDRADYADALLAVGRAPASSLALGCAMTGKADIKSRITRVLSSGLVSITPLYQRLAAGAAVIAIAVFALAPVRGETVYKVGDNVTVPRILDKTEPAYTEEARQTKVSGTVVLSCVVRPDGMAHDCTVTKGLDPGLDRNAALAIEQWHFAPATKDGEPVAVSVTIEVNFRLQ